MPVVLVLAASFTNLLLLRYVEQPSASWRSHLSAALLEEFIAAAGTEASAEGLAPIDSDNFLESEPVNFIIVDSNSLLSVSNPLSNILPTRDGLLIYKIQAGDNLSKIAANFGISLNTIFWANPNLKAHLISPGQEIVILPVTGILHQVQEGETLDSIAGQYSVEVKKILDHNPGILKNFSVGATVIIPGVRPPAGGSVLASVAGLPSYPGYFAIPTTGWNWGHLHHYNAVDIANACGTPIYASAEGLVVEAPVGGWNNGYGNYVMIEHPNETKTRYAHNQKNLVSVGDYVVKGDLIAYVGNTGNTHGPTGCHLHFEIRGAKNPFAK